MEVDTTGEFRSALVNLKGRLNEAGPSNRLIPPSRRRAILEQIEAALQRLEQGTYGICRRCSLVMPRAELLMRPYAEYCPNCQARKAA